MDDVQVKAMPDNERAWLPLTADGTTGVVKIQLAEGTTETLTVTRLAADRYRLDDTPITTLFDAIPLLYGDIIEAMPEEDGTLHFQTVAIRSNLLLSTFMVSRVTVESEGLATYLQAVEAVGGYSERIFGGILLVYIPADSAFKAEAEFARALDTIAPSGREEDQNDEVIPTLERPMDVTYRL